MAYDSWPRHLAPPPPRPMLAAAVIAVAGVVGVAGMGALLGMVTWILLLHR